ncbi:MAG: hypothetical protein EXR71_02610 [Myxococcales bacterium]|nr:hypothetical protein [Myxococcales bacterium]
MLLLLGCEPNPAADPEPPHAGGAAAFAPPPAEPLWTAQETAAAIEVALAGGVPLPSPALDLWFELLSHGTGDCPGGAYLDGVLTALAGGGCLAPSGYRYSGAGLGARGWSDGDGDGVEDTWTEELKADGQIRDPEGASFFFGGAMSLTLSGTREDGGDFVGEVLGTYRYERAQTEWLRSGTSTATYLSGSVAADTWRVRGDGGFAVGEAALVMVGFELGGACGEHPTGTLGIRDPGGRWVDLSFDGSTCDGCGRMVFDGRVELGTVCIDVREPFAAAMAELQASAGIGATR